MKWVVLYLIIILTAPSPTFARKNSNFIFAGHDIEPFYFKEGSVGIQGAAYDVMKEICKKEELTCKFKIAPLRQSLNSVKTGAAHAGGPFLKSQQRETILHFSKPIFKSEFIFLGTAELAKKIKSYNDLAGLSAVAMAPSMTWISLQRINQITGNKMKLSGEPVESNVIRKTENKNYNLAYVSKEYARAYFSHNPSSNLKEIPNLGEPFDIYLVFSKKSVRNEEFQKIDAAIDEFRKSSAMKEIANKYHLELAP